MEEVRNVRDGLLGANDRRTIGTLRLVRANTQAVTVVTDETQAQQLLERRFISVGLVRCRVERRIDLARCARCWGYDQSQRECKGNEI
ncbi:hypothetical protein GWI33_013563 [Rhynchophorus ferrugineus]|uniref:Uncharacterized protein n=1 Tax=Rhynchophorus ferrugineus TaxID=354439 RepID=A0A834I4D7_RHYFE|nr:hypothetical protein GWI33_013563 [Rhynchophorus ferrugineus]